MTYQRNIRGLFLEDRVDQGLPDGVEQPEVAPGDDDEAERDRRPLPDLAAVRPLHPAQLLHGGADEAADPTAAGAAGFLAGGGDGGGALLGVRRAAGAGSLVLVVVPSGPHLGRLGAGLGQERLVDFGGGVLERIGRGRAAQVPCATAAAAAAGRAGRAAGRTCAALLGALTVAGHGRCSSAPSGSLGGTCADGTTCSTCAA